MKVSSYYPIEILHWAGMNDNCLEDLKKIVHANMEHVHTLNDYQDNCLIIASRMGNLEMVKFLVENSPVHINHANKEGNALLVALAKGHMEIVHYFLDATAIDVSTTNSAGKGLFHLAASQAQSELIEKLLGKTNPSCFTVDKAGRHCLFDFMESYPLHRDYWCFEVIIQSLTAEQLYWRDLAGNNILDWIGQLQEKNPHHAPFFEPLLAVLHATP